MHLPNFTRRRLKQEAALEPITFVPIRKVFEAQVEVRPTRDLSGYAPGETRKRWEMRHGRVYQITDWKAREFVAKGYVELVHEGSLDHLPAVSEMEQAELNAQNTIIGPGAANG